MKPLLIDTSILIDFLRQKDKEKTVYYQLTTEDLHIALITHTELYAGKSVWEHAYAKKELDTLFSNLTILSFEPEISQKAGYLKAHYPSINLIDCIIAAHAQYYEMPLVTFNVKDFRPIHHLTIYKI